jgi:hypothetical protein
MSPLVSKQTNYFPKLAVPGFTEHNTIVDHNIRYWVVTWPTIRHYENPLFSYYAAAFIETTFFARAGLIFHQPLTTEDYTRRCIRYRQFWRTRIGRLNWGQVNNRQMSLFLSRDVPALDSETIDLPLP